MQPFLTAFYRKVVPTAILLPFLFYCIYSTYSIGKRQRTLSPLPFLFIYPPSQAGERE